MRSGVPAGRRRLIFWQIFLWGVGRRRRFRVVGISMEPTLKEGDHLFVSRATPGGGSPLQEGNVVVVRHPRDPSQVLVKRVERLGHQGLWLRGDNPVGTDSRQFGPVELTQVLGVVRGYIGDSFGEVPASPKL